MTDIAVSGTRTNIIVCKASTWGTATAASTGDKYIGELTWKNGAEVLKKRSQGSGKFMTSGFTRGAYKPTVVLTGDVYANSAFGKILAQFMGADSVSAEQTASQADYIHTITVAAQSKYLSVAFESSDATVIEFPTCSVRSLTISTTSIPGYLQFTAELVANKVEFSTAVNTNAVLAAATIVDTEVFAPSDEDDFWLDTQASGSLASGDQFNLISYSLEMSRPQESVNEIKGSAGNGAPVVQDDFAASLTLGVASLKNHAIIAHHVTEAGLKSLFTIEGSQIGSGLNKALNIYVPRMQLIQEPDYGITNPGINPVTYKFDISAADSNPTGMTSQYPYLTLVNGLSTGYQA